MKKEYTLKEAELCNYCGGNGLVGLERDLPCDNCNGTGKESDEIVIERIVNNINSDQEEKLATYFHKGDGWAVHKDNWESAYENWVERLSKEELTKIIYG